MEISFLDRARLQTFYKCFTALMREGYSNFSEQLQNHFLDQIYNIDFFSKVVENNSAPIFIATEQDKVIGFLVANRVYGGVGFVSWIGVDKGNRNRGIASNLLQKYCDLLEMQGGHLVELNTYEGAQGFYEHLGFVKIGERSVGYFGQQNIIMNKQIGKYMPHIFEVTQTA